MVLDANAYGLEYHFHGVIKLFDHRFSGGGGMRMVGGGCECDLAGR